MAGVHRKIILWICDGMGDRPHLSLGHKTPLQYARTPNMDRVAALGQCGIMDVIAPGVTPGSDTAHLALLGYDPHEIYTGRGPFEAAGVGIDVREGDVAFRCNFATVKDGVVVDRRAGRIKEGTETLAKALDGMVIEDVEVIFRAGAEHRGALVLRGPGLSPDVTDGDPHATGVPVPEVKPTSPEGEKTSRVLNEFIKRAMETLSSHPLNAEREKKGLLPANAILPRGGGVVPHIPSITEKTGLRVAGVVGVTLVKGICRATGIDLVERPEFTGGADTDMMGKAREAVKALQDHDMVLVNVKAPDLMGHDDRPMEKAKTIEKIDEAIGYVLDNMPGDTIFALTADHSTPCTFKEHAGDPVPLAIYGRGHRFDNVGKYDEISCAAGSIGRIRGMDLLPILMNMGGYSKKYGA